MQLRLPWSAPAPAPAPPAAPRPRTITIDGRVLSIVIARHRWARRYVARVTPGGEVRLTVPRGASIAAGLAFVEREAAWVGSEWRRVRQRTEWGHGTELRYRGELVTLVRDDAMIAVGAVRFRCAVDEDPRAVLERHWRAEAARELPARCLALAEARGLRPESVRVRNQRSRWGACSGRGAITLNWRLLQMPPDVADYVMLHELAHLRQPNHSRRFWREVESLCPGWRSAERWLKTFGRDLL
ncbi:MAG: SprT family zinc-dependent metalloprotease [Acidobacteriota bacterium]